MTTRWFIRLSLIVLVSSALFNSCISNGPTGSDLSREEYWKGDIDFLTQQLKAKHKNLFFKVPETQFKQQAEEIIKSIDQLQDYEIMIKMTQLVASIGDAHTRLIPNNIYIYRTIPIRCYWFSDGLYITDADFAYYNLVGLKILKVGGVPIDEAFKKIKTVISYENESWAKYQGASALIFAEILKTTGLINNVNSVELELEGLGKIVFNSGVWPISNFVGALLTVELPLYLQKTSEYYWYTYIQNSKTIYLKYNVCQNSQKPFADFVKEIETFINSNPVEKLVIDLRNNSGGNSSIIDPLIALIKNKPSINSKGKLFVVTGRQTFSSALLNSITLKQTTNAILIGEPTGGKPNSYGEVQTFGLPNSGSIATYSVKYFQTVTGDPDSLYPDYEIYLNYKQFSEGKDPVLDFILNYK